MGSPEVQVSPCRPLLQHLETTSDTELSSHRLLHLCSTVVKDNTSQAQGQLWLGPLLAVSGVCLSFLLTEMGLLKCAP